MATFDEDYKKTRQKQKQKQARHVGEGVAMGAKEFGEGLFKGITGIVVQPVKGVQKEGALGFFKGVGRGVTGLVAKPVV